MGGGAVQSRFRDYAPEGMKLIETLSWLPGRGPVRTDLHMARLANSCKVFDMAFPMSVLGLLSDVVGHEPLRLRLTVDLAGRSEISHAPMPPRADRWRIAISRDRLRSLDPWLRFKTTRRPVHDRVRAALPSGVDEMILLNERDEICEGTISNLFLQRDGMLLTPPVTSGCLPGVLRASLMRAGRAKEAVLRPSDLDTGRLFMGNSVRGLIEAELT